MRVKNTTEKELYAVLDAVNKIYDNNIEFVYLTVNKTNRGTTAQFTLRVKESKGKGARLSQSLTTKGNRRHLINACWHVHGAFFDVLLTVNPKAIITTGKTQIFVNQYGEIVNNWQDWNIGSIMYPFYYSEACECDN